MSIGDKKIEKSLEFLIESIRNSETYRNYMMTRQEVAEKPELQEQIDAFRMKNFEMQQTYEGEELLEKIEEFSQEYAAFRENPLVDQYLCAELSFCRMIQEIDDIMLKELDFH